MAGLNGLMMVADDGSCVGCVGSMRGFQRGEGRK